MCIINALTWGFPGIPCMLDGNLSLSLSLSLSLPLPLSIVKHEQSSKLPSCCGGMLGMYIMSPSYSIAKMKHYSKVRVNLILCL